MMRKEQVISKGKYVHEQPRELMGVKQYLFIKDTDGKKRLLLRFCNYRNEKCSKFAFILYRMDAKGRVIGQERYESADRDYLEKEVFSFHQKIDVEERCTDFKIQIIYAVYGNYTYRAIDGDVAVSYSEKTVRHLSNDVRTRPRKIFHRTFEIPWVFAVLSVIILALGFTIMGILLMDFKEREDEFTLSGVTYRFLDNDAKEDVIITGCAPAYREIVLSTEIEGHKVVGIEPGAFEKNRNIVKLTIDGLDIPANAFEDCSKLQTLVIKNVNIIGKEAFYDCDKLESVVITEGSENQILKIGSAAFGDCNKLTSVEIDQTISYGAAVDFLRNSKNIDTLKLRNFAFAMKGVNSAYVTRLNQLYGYSYTDASDARLRVLEIDNMDLIPANFAYGFTKLESVTVNNTNIKIVGDNAFRDCRSLSSVNTKGNLVTVGAYAFSGTLIKSVDLSHVTTLGEYAFKDAIMLSSVKGFGNTGIDTVPKGAFYGCKSLSTFNLHANIKHLAMDAFRDTGLKRFALPEGVTYETGILRNCQKLTELEIYSLTSGEYVGRIFGASDASSLSKLSSVIPTSLKSIVLLTGERIYDNAFRGCTGVTVIDLPDDIVSVGRNAFEGCKNLKEIDIPYDSVKLERIEQFAFAGCESIKVVPFPTTLEYIGVGAFSGCNKLESLTLLYLGPTPNDDGNDEKVSFLFNGTVPTSLNSVSLMDLEIIDLPANAFYGCKGVKEITIPATVKTVGDSSFRNCAALKTLKYTDTVSGGEGVIDLQRITSIGHHAFDGCTALEAPSFNPEIEELGEYAFASTGLKEFALPSSALEIGECLLQGCDKLESFTADFLGTSSIGEKTVSFFFGSSVPSSLKTITIGEFRNNQIPNRAFKNCVGVTTFNLPEGIVAVGDEAFYGCESLEAYDLTGVTSIGNSAFAKCVKLTGCDLSGVQNIGNGAFAGTGLVEVQLAEGLTGVKSEMFASCANLTSVVLPSTLEAIGSYAFKDTAITSIEIPEGVTKIGAYAFANTPLTALEIPKTVTSLEQCVVEGCESLESISFPLTEEFYVNDGYGGYLQICYSLFNDEFPQSLKKVEINSCEAGSYYLFSSAFASSEYLDEVIICEGITHIDYNAFAYCPELRFVSLPSSLDSIDSSAFEGCIHLYEVANPSGCYIYADSLIQLSDSLEGRAPQVTTKSGYRFARYNGEWYLISCPDVSVIKPDASFSYQYSVITDFKIPHYLYYGDVSVTEVILPVGVTGIDKYAFYCCSKLTKLEMQGSNALYIGDYAFADTALVNAKLASSIEKIGNRVFAECNYLKSVIFPTSLKTIGDYAFYNCNVLNNVKLYQDVYSIGEEAFVGCNVLYDVYNSSSLNIVAGEFGNGNVSRNAVKVHTNMTEASSVEVTVSGLGTFRRSGTSWLLLKGENVSTLKLDAFKYQGETASSFRIAQGAFEGCRAIKEIIITDAVKQIQAGAFRNCTSLVKLDCSKNTSLNIIEERAFMGCSSLRYVTLPSSVTVLCNSVFKDCAMLESVVMPEKLVTIEAHAFEDCKRLISVVIGKDVQSIGTDAFYGCYQLFEVYDLSEYVYISRGTQGNGYVGYYANEVFTDKSSALQRYEADGAKLIKLYVENGYVANGYVWYLYSFEDKGREIVDISLPDNCSLVILANSFINGTFKGLVLPASLTRVENGAFNQCSNFNTIYYMGTSDSWYDVSGSRPYKTMRYYQSCIHYDTSSDAWTYDASGKVTTDRCKEGSAEVITPATCYHDGQNAYYCQCCKYPRFETVERKEHNFVEGVCTLCGGTEVAVNSENLQALVDSGMIFVDQFAFDVEKEAFASQNKLAYTRSSFKIIATQRMTVSFEIQASCRRGYDYVYVSGGGYSNYSITDTSSKVFSIVLEAGQTVEISYERSSSNSTSNDNCGYIKDLKFVKDPLDTNK